MKLKAIKLMLIKITRMTMMIMMTRMTKMTRILESRRFHQTRRLLIKLEKRIIVASALINNKEMIFIKLLLMGLGFLLA